MTILEECDSDYRSQLKLWENTQGQIWLEIGYGDNDPCTTQGIPLTRDDAKALIQELSRILQEMDSETPIRPKQLQLTY